MEALFTLPDPAFLNVSFLSHQFKMEAINEKVALLTERQRLEDPSAAAGGDGADARNAPSIPDGSGPVMKVNIETLRKLAGHVFHQVVANTFGGPVFPARRGNRYKGFEKVINSVQSTVGLFKHSLSLTAVLHDAVKVRVPRTP